MELSLAGSEDTLLKSLSFDLKPSANYITNRRMTSFYPTGSSSFSPGGVRVCRIVLSGDGWVDLSSLLMQFTLANSDPDRTVMPISFADGGSPGQFFDRVRVLAAGTPVEDVWYQHRLQLMMERCLPANLAENTYIDGFVLNDGVACGITANSQCTM